MHLQLNLQEILLLYAKIVKLMEISQSKSIHNIFLNLSQHHKLKNLLKNRLNVYRRYLTKYLDRYKINLWHKLIVL